MHNVQDGQYSMSDVYRWQYSLCNVYGGHYSKCDVYYGQYSMSDVYRWTMIVIPYYIAQWVMFTVESTRWKFTLDCLACGFVV